MSLRKKLLVIVSVFISVPCRTEKIIGEEAFKKFQEFFLEVLTEMQTQPDFFIKGIHFGTFLHGFGLRNVEKSQNEENEKIIVNYKYTPANYSQAFPHVALITGALLYTGYSKNTFQEQEPTAAKDPLVTWAARGLTLTAGAASAYITLSLINQAIKP